MGRGLGPLEGLEVVVVKDKVVRDKVIKKVVSQYKTYRPLAATKNILYNFQTRERKKSFGNLYPEKTFYIIRPIDNNSPFYIGVGNNLLANYFYVVSHLKYAQDKGLTPVVDHKNYPVYNSICGEIDGVDNPWEYFWEQPSRHTLEEAYAAQNVILSKRSWFWEWDLGYDAENYTDKKLIRFYHQLTECIPLKAPIVHHIDTVRKQLFDPKEKVLGVSFRYGGHSKESSVHGPGHPISPEVDTLIEHVAKKCSDWGMDRIFFASDEESAVEDFRGFFGDRLICLDRERRRKEDLKAMFCPKNFYETTLSYLTEMELLAGCAGIIGSITSGFRYAVVRSNNSCKYIEAVDSGRFPDVRKYEYDNSGCR